MSESRWFRVNCDWWESDWLCVLSAEARLAWILFLGRAKTHGSGGVLKKTPTMLLARQWMIGEEAIIQALKAAENNGAVVDEGGSWLITGWAKFQGDQTAAERQAEFRRRRQVQEEAKRNGSNALPALRNACNGDVDVDSDIDNITTPLPPKGDGGPAAQTAKPRRKAVDHSEGVPIPETLKAIPGFESTWRDRCDQRYAKPTTRFPTATAAEKELAQLAGCRDPVDVLNRAIAGSWQGLNIKPSDKRGWVPGQAPGTPPTVKPQTSDSEFMAKALTHYLELGYDDEKAREAARAALERRSA